jgi:hypothetical protein
MTTRISPCEPANPSSTAEARPIFRPRFRTITGNGPDSVDAKSAVPSGDPSSTTTNSLG